MGSQLSVPQSKCTVAVRMNDPCGTSQQPVACSTIECSLEFPLNDYSFEIDIINGYPDYPAKKCIGGKKEKDFSNTLGLGHADKGADPCILVPTVDEDEPLISSSESEKESSVTGAGNPILTPSTSTSTSSDTSTGSSSTGTLSRNPVINDNNVRGMLLVIKVMMGGIQKVDMDGSRRGCLRGIGMHGWNR